MYRLASFQKLAFLLFLAAMMISALMVSTNPVHAQDSATVDEPFTVLFAMSGVDNETGFVTNWVTANNVTNAVFYNAYELDSQDPKGPDGFIEQGVPLPNGTMQVGDIWKACTIIFKDMYLTCDTGFNWPTNRPEADSIAIPHNNTS